MLYRLVERMYRLDEPSDFVDEETAEFLAKEEQRNQKVLKAWKMPDETSEESVVALARQFIPWDEQHHQPRYSTWSYRLEKRIDSSGEWQFVCFPEPETPEERDRREPDWLYYPGS